MILNTLEWKSVFEEWGEEIASRFNHIYGSDSDLIRKKRLTLLSMLETFYEMYGDKPCVITRSPGRVNLLGRHIEHRGGSINVMSIDRETFLICGKRDDDKVNLANTDSKYLQKGFRIYETLGVSDNTDWLSYIESDETLRLVMESKGDWSNYVKASVLRLALEFKTCEICGMDMLFSGDIPIAAGLSSSSSIVVATTEALAELNSLNIEAKDFIHLCGEGEWFVGSRGGAGDHAAMKCSERDMIVHLDFCPFKIGESVPFPSEYNVVVANSYIEAKKSEGARDKFNMKVACYEFGFWLFRKYNPEYANKLNYLKDISPDNLGVDDSQIYQMLKKVPEYLTLDEVKGLLPEYKREIERICLTHNPPEYYEIRSTVLYGITECLRAQLCPQLLKNGDYEALGELMAISHNGDRVTKEGRAYDYSASDAYLDRLILENAPLYKQPGGYACSIPMIDDLVDYCTSLPGVLGAELSGAGLGGCIIILVHKDHTNELLSSLKDYYYDKNSLPMGARVYKPCAGSLAF